MTGTQIIKQGRGILEAGGWVVRSMNYHKATPRGMHGFPDMIAFKGGVTLLLEIKGDGDRIRPDQEQFFNEVKPHTGMCLRYFLVHDIEQIVDIAEMRMIA